MEVLLYAISLQATCIVDALLLSTLIDAPFAIDDAPQEATTTTVTATLL